MYRQLPVHESNKVDDPYTILRSRLSRLRLRHQTPILEESWPVKNRNLTGPGTERNLLHTSRRPTCQPWSVDMIIRIKHLSLFLEVSLTRSQVPEPLIMKVATFLTFLVTFPSRTGVRFCARLPPSPPRLTGITAARPLLPGHHSRVTPTASDQRMSYEWRKKNQNDDWLYHFYWVT